MQLLEKLGGLLAKGILTQQEFDAKKAELLSRIK
ncbi:SHOCT domain-containing protein [Mesorhizobium sp. M4A.F.Ca.ET.050.02.1.1]|nr:SHOCT domain-containing protein [Mesorhizobium sp. M4A.F.Ca.ET.050.02.1.1]